jgi:hypothetical protein
MKLDLDCPHCGSNMIKSYADEAKLRMKLIKWNRDGMFAVCKGCGHDVSIGLDFMKSVQSSFVFEVPGDGQEKENNTDTGIANI